ncbi:unnamed protein product, partial [Mesorhabditis belari]|uniref:Uncharacterized protein n=1 Tax=Mesorhabditis belari TaxID=2138241 RepID=A0AAF3EW59_9BILA
MPPRWATLVLMLFTIFWGNAEARQQCELITIPLCKGIGYNMTSYPNPYGHEKQEEAGLEVHQFYPLVEVGCYQHLKFFLCALYTPICQEGYDRPIPPCMELCLEAKKRCSPIMHKYGFRWPETLSCDGLPKMSDQFTSGNICAAPPDTPTKNHKQTINHPIASLEIVPDVGISIPEECVCRCSRPFEKAAQSSKVGDVSGCAYSCRAPTHSTLSNQSFVNSWIAVWSITCFSLSIFTVLTFLIETDRFQYPERPIFVLAFCQAMVAVGFLLRAFFGHEAVACDAWKVRGADDGGDSLCFIVFFLTYFFGMAASVWWVILSLTWLLAAGCKWSTEAIASYSIHFHLIAWGLPAIQTSLVLILSAVDGDPVSGICYVGNTNVQFLRIFVLTPLVVYFSMGVLFLAIGFFNLWRIRIEVQKHHHGLESASKVTQLMSKIGIFSVLYTVPALFLILVLFYEQRNRPQWEEAALCPCSNSKTDSAKATLLLSLIKSASMLVVGWTSGVWISSRKTLRSWRDFFCCSRGTHKYQQAEILYGKSECSTPHFYNSTLRQQNLFKQPMLPEKL